MHTIAVGGSQLDVADSAFGPKNQQLSVVALTGFENVSRHAFEKRELAPGEKPENIVLHFNPRTGQDMLLACSGGSQYRCLAQRCGPRDIRLV